MKKFNRFIIWIFILIVECFFYSETSTASSLNVSVFGVSFVQSESSKMSKLGDGILKKEEFYIINHYYPNNFSDSFEKYITVRTIITYLEESTGKALAFVSVESNFRFNSLMRKAQCLSTSKDNVAMCSECSLDVFVRRANVLLDKGQSIFNLKFNLNGKTYDENSCKISCDFIGNIFYN